MIELVVQLLYTAVKEFVTIGIEGL